MQSSLSLFIISSYEICMKECVAGHKVHVLIPEVVMSYYCCRLGVQVLLLVRDPRGTMQSRHHRNWCPGNPDCDDPAWLCRDLVSDFHTAKKFLKKFPDSFRLVMYMHDFLIIILNSFPLHLVNFAWFAVRPPK